MFSAFCTVAVFKPALSLILTNRVPMIDKIIPIPAINIGNKIGDKPPKASTNWALLAPVTS